MVFKKKKEKEEEEAKSYCKVYQPDGSFNWVTEDNLDRQNYLEVAPEYDPTNKMNYRTFKHVSLIEKMKPNPMLIRKESVSQEEAKEEPLPKFSEEEKEETILDKTLSFEESLELIAKSSYLTMVYIRKIAKEGIPK